MQLTLQSERLTGTIQLTLFPRLPKRLRQRRMEIRHTENLVIRTDITLDQRRRHLGGVGFRRS